MSESIKKNWFETTLILFILLAITLTLINLLHNRSLWLDEAALALNIVSRSYLELLKPLADGQSAPIGFLFIDLVVIITLLWHTVRIPGEGSS